MHSSFAESTSVLFWTALFAHGADPTPLAWDEALANLVKFLVAFLLIGFMSYPILQPLLTAENVNIEDESLETSSTELERSNNGVVGWMAVGMTLILAMGWWLTRTSLIEVNTEDVRNKEEHAHTQVEGGQIAMWGDFHAEVVRVESGELRVYLRDSYNRDIASRFFQAKVQAFDPESNDPLEASTFSSTTEALNESFRFVRLPLEAKHYRVKISTPGWSSTLKFSFDGSQGKRSLPIWCASPAN